MLKDILKWFSAIYARTFGYSNKHTRQKVMRHVVISKRRWSRVGWKFEDKLSVVM